MAKNSGDGFIESRMGRVILVFFGAVIFVGCSLDGNSEPTSTNKPATATTQPAEPDWRIDEPLTYYEGIHYIDISTEKSEEVDLLESVSAEDVNSNIRSLDHLSDEEGLTVADVEVKLLSKPKYGTAKLNKKDATLTYTPWTDFEGTDEIRYSLKLKGKPDVVEGRYVFGTIDLS
ncbi:Ig-like domain-containing protein [Streptomyces prasinus]|uniref:Ig-like domain-containing protein n=1 Tax=Streptomyces prasinus TaxID=67345 RepID=UPI0033EF149D